MFEQVIKKGLHYRGEKCPELMGLEGNGFGRLPGREHTRQEFAHFPISPLEHLGIETKLITKVLKEQTFVVTRLRSDGVNRCPIKPVLSEHSFCRTQYGLACSLRIIDSFPTSFPSRFRHTFLFSLFII